MSKKYKKLIKIGIAFESIMIALWIGIIIAHIVKSEPVSMLEYSCAVICLICIFVSMVLKDIRELRIPEPMDKQKVIQELKEDGSVKAHMWDEDYDIRLNENGELVIKILEEEEE